MIEPFRPGVAGDWDRFLTTSVNGTFLESRRFLGYHGDRFRDRSLVFRDERGRWRGALPAAEDPRDPSRVVSHPGVTYGGLFHDGSLSGRDNLDLLGRACEQFREWGYAAWRYRVVPWIYHRVPSQADVYALVRLGAKRSGCELSSTIDLAARRPPSQRRRRGARKGERSGVEVEARSAAVDDFWAVLRENLGTRFAREPVHDEREIRLLMELFPVDIELVVARLGGGVVGGSVLFHTPGVTHAQYIASNAEGRHAAALDRLFEVVIAAAAARGARYFDFGISTEQSGEWLNESLEAFKHEFGGGTVLYETYELAL